MQDTEVVYLELERAVVRIHDRQANRVHLIPKKKKKIGVRKKKEEGGREKKMTTIFEHSAEKLLLTYQWEVVDLEYILWN